jgi:hypothetical protein
MSVCAPKAVAGGPKDSSCFDRGALVRLANAWNQSNKENPIRNIKKLGKVELWKAIQKRMNSTCKGEDKEACWVDKLMPASDPINKKLRPVQPEEWEKNPYEWLSNFDIEDAMRQYEENRDYRFKFIGVFPVDFAMKTGFFGKCLYEETCNIQFKRLLKRGYDYAGMVINMDRHDEPGSHWTALFIVMNPKLPSYGAYYYNSVPSNPPKEVESYMAMLKETAEKETPGVPFKLQSNSYRHQYKNTECGVFSMTYLVRWLVLLQKNKNTSFDKVVNIGIRDEDVHKLRKKFFRKK